MPEFTREQQEVICHEKGNLLVSAAAGSGKTAVLVERILHLQEEMQVHSRLKITGMINNTNLAQLTTPAELRDGYEMIKEVSQITGVPVKYTSGKKEMLDIFLAEGHDPKYIGTPLAIDTYMRRDWDSWIKGLDEQ